MFPPPASIDCSRGFQGVTEILNATGNRPEFWREPARVIESPYHMMVPLAVTMPRSPDPLGLMFCFKRNMLSGSYFSLSRR